MPAKLTTQTIRKIRSMARKGKKPKQIAKRLDVPVDQVEMVIASMKSKKVKEKIDPVDKPISAFKDELRKTYQLVAMARAAYQDDSTNPDLGMIYTRLVESMQNQLLYLRDLKTPKQEFGETMEAVQQTMDVLLKANATHLGTILKELENRVDAKVYSEIREVSHAALLSLSSTVKRAYDDMAASLSEINGVDLTHEQTEKIARAAKELVDADGETESSERASGHSGVRPNRLH